MILPIQVMDHEMGDEQPDHATIASSSSDNTMSQASPAPANTVKVAAGYVLQQRLGSGSFASVYKGIKLDEYRQSINSGQPPPPHSIAAIKAISRQSKKLTKKVLENLELEIAILQTYRHPNICCLHDVQKTERHIYLVLEYCGGGDLQRLIRTRQKGRLSEKLCRRLVRDLAAGLRFLWGKQVVHRDIKPQNLLLTGPLPSEDEAENPARENAKNIAQEVTGGFMLQIADFGFARHLTGVDMAETMCGSPLYMAPEILSGEKYDAKADLWSVGTVLFEMISGKTPFHGENHLDLLRNIKTKAVRLPADVRVSKECVKLLKLTLDRKPHSRTDFKGFLEASEAFVALGCNGVPPPEGSTAPLNEMALNSSQQIVDRGVCARMNLCAISENDGLGESTQQQQRDNQNVQQSPMTNYIPNTGSAQTQTKAMNTSSQTNRDSDSKPGFVTPPFNAAPAPNPPPALQTGLQGNLRRVSVFAPLQASPNISPSVTPSGASPPAFSLQGFVSKQVSSLPLPRPGVFPIRLQGDSNPRNGTPQQQHQLSQTTFANNQAQGRKNSTPKTSSHESSSSSESGFVFVDHTGSKPGSGTNSPSTSGLLRSPSLSPRSSSGRITILDAKNAGMLATSPGTGRALVGKMMMGSPPGRSNMTMTPTTSGKFPVSPRSALRQGGCLAHIETLARMLAASEDIGRRAITVAHLGDVRAYLAMGLLVAQRDESQSSLSSSTPMEGVVEDKRSSSTKQFASRNNTIEEEDEDDFPFAMATSSEEMSQSPAGNIMANLAPIIGNASNEDSNEEMSPCMIEVHFREALECYLKTLSMMNGSIRAAQKVLKEIEDVINNLSSRMTPDANNPYTPLRKRCNASLEWLQGQFSAVLERADAAEKQISKLQKANQTQQMDGSGTSVCVQELIYNHSLKCGQEGAVKQLLGHYEAARSCYRSAGLLAETLLMESKVGEDDRSVLEGYVHSFADQIMELDDLIRATRSSRLGSQSTAASTIKRLSSTGASPALAS
mmetsp:Transcript_31762/g.64168  ORF Transcript_31762/g.64168 Transcript_31762/m.64168 type:complete len:1009 (+) Transcript_31762:429-3455(+)